MSDTTTPRLGLIQPSLDGSENTWGGKLNEDLDFIDAALNAAMPVGTILAYAGSTVPTGWLLCDGRPVSRTTYGPLFAALGGYYGEGDGMTTFNLPNLQACYVVGTGTGTDASGNTTSYLLGQEAGYYQALIGQANLPNTTLTVTTGDHVHNYVSLPSSYGFALQAGNPGSSASFASVTMGPSGEHTHSIWLNGGGNGLPVTQLSLVLNRIVFAGVQTIMAGAPRSVMRSPMRGSR